MSKKNVLSKFTILCWAAFIVILGCMWPIGHGLDTPAGTNQADIVSWTSSLLNCELINLCCLSCGILLQEP